MLVSRRPKRLVLGPWSTRNRSLPRAPLEACSLLFISDMLPGMKEFPQSFNRIVTVSETAVWRRDTVAKRLHASHCDFLRASIGSFSYPEIYARISRDEEMWRSGTTFCRRDSLSFM